MLEVAKTLERYFNIQIDLSASKYKNCPVNLGKILQPSLEEMLLTLESTFDYKIEKQADNTYVIQGGICD